MRKSLLLILALALVCLGAQQLFAFGDHHNQGQQQGQIGINENDNSNRNTNLQGQGQGQEQGQGQLQGQLQGQGQAQGQGQLSVGKVNVQDNSEYESYSFAPPGIKPVVGTETANVYSIFGGIGLSNTEEYQVCIEKLSTVQAMEKAGYLTSEEAQEEAMKAYIQMKDSTKPRRILGFGPKTRGRHLLNLFGFLANDSWVNEDKVNERIIEKENATEEIVVE